MYRGVDQCRFEPNRGFDGQTFFKSYWWLSSKRAGAQMAKIITYLDRYCELGLPNLPHTARSLPMIDAVVKVYF